MHVPDLTRLPSAIGTVYPLGLQPKFRYSAIVISGLVFDVCEPLTKAALDLLDTYNTKFEHLVIEAENRGRAPLGEWVRGMLERETIPNVRAEGWSVGLRYEYIEGPGNTTRIVPTLTAKHQRDSTARPVTLLGIDENPVAPPAIFVPRR